MGNKTENVRMSKEFLKELDRRRQEFGLSRPAMSRIIAVQMRSLDEEIELVRKKQRRNKLRIGGENDKFRLV